MWKNNGKKQIRSNFGKSLLIKLKKNILDID